MLNASPRHGSFHIPGARIVKAGDPFKSIIYYRMSSLGGSRMPRLGSTVVDEQGLDLIYQWVRDLASTETKPVVDADSGLTSTVGALRLALAIERRELPGELAEQMVQQAAAGEPHIRDLFERFIPESQRTRRLGSSVDPPTILQLDGDIKRGKHLFLEQTGVQCKSCHRIGDRGAAVGPDLNQIGKKYSRSQLLESILQPSKKIDAEYLQHQCITTDGRSYSGVVTEKTDEFVVLRDAQAKSHIIARNDIDVLQAMSTSLMPELLVRDMTAQQVADLVAYLSSLREGT